MTVRSCLSALQPDAPASASIPNHGTRALAGVMQILLLTTLSVSVGAATPEKAQRTLPTGGHAGALFIPAWDTDGDGKVSRAEYEAVRAQRFASADEDGDGALNADEYVNEYAVRLDRQIADERKAAIEQTHTRFRALDKDADGFISAAEYAASGERAFVHLDHDKDGRVANSDPQAAAAVPAASNDAERAKLASERRNVRQRSVIGMPSTHSLEGLLKIYDTDGDGVVTREQYDAQRQAAFAATDANGDGKVSQTEYVDEFADRLDRQIARSRQAQLKQGHVRFEAIDSDKNGSISRDEYMTMSARMFERVDTNKDGVVSLQDPPPPARERREGQERSVATAASQP